MTTDPTHPSEEKIRDTSRFRQHGDRLEFCLHNDSVHSSKMRLQLRSGNATTVTGRRNGTKKETFYPANDVNQFITALNKTYMIHDITEYSAQIFSIALTVAMHILLWHLAAIIPSQISNYFLPLFQRDLLHKSTLFSGCH